MEMALTRVGRQIDYDCFDTGLSSKPAIDSSYGTSTPAGDLVELEAVRAVFGDRLPPLSSTKALTGHSLGAASVHEAIYCLLMMQDGFMAGSANITTLDPQAADFPILRESRDGPVDTVLSNSFGFGGTNGTLVFRTV